MLQDIYEVSSTKHYPIGMRYAKGERVFRYCKSGLTMAIATHWGWGNANRIAVDGVALPGIVAAGVTDVTITDAVAALNDYEDGWLQYWRIDAATRNQMYHIKGNEASLGGQVVLHLHDAVYSPMGAGSAISVHKSIYSNCIMLGESYAPGVRGFRTVVCIPLICAPSGEYFWGQTWGPCMGAWASTEPGSAEYLRELDFSPFDGALILHSQVAGYGLTISAQRAGYVLPHTATGAGNGSGTYMLQLSP